MGGVPACADRALACADERNELQNEERARTHARTHAQTQEHAGATTHARLAHAAHAEEREEREKEERRHKMDADGFILVERRSKVSTPSSPALPAGPASVLLWLMRPLVPFTAWERPKGRSTRKNICSNPRCGRRGASTASLATHRSARSRESTRAPLTTTPVTPTLACQPNGHSIAECTKALRRFSPRLSAVTFAVHSKVCIA